MRNYLVVILLACFSASSLLAAESALRPFTASYNVQLNGFKVGELTRSLKQLDDSSYRLETYARTTGLTALFVSDVAKEVSLMQMVGSELLPLKYEYNYTGRGRDVSERQKFDWQQGRLTSLRNGNRTIIDLAPGTLDKQVFEIAMRQDLEQGMLAGSHQVAVRGRIRDYDYQVLGNERIVTRPFGEVDTIKVARGTTIMWLAPEHDFMLVRIQQQDRNNKADSFILSVEYH